MKAKPYKMSIVHDKECLSPLGRETYTECSPEEATHIWLHMPGPFPNRCLSVILKGSREEAKARSGRPVWTWNGSTDAPTLMPSLLTKGQAMPDDAQLARIQAGEKNVMPDLVCHTWVTDGKAQFLDDCSHEFAGQTLDLLDIE